MFRLLSGFIVSALMLQDLTWAAPILTPTPAVRTMPEVDFRIPASSGVVDDYFRAPAATAAGAVEDAGSSISASGRNKLIVLVQDAHTNPSAQFNAARVLDEVLSKESIDLVFTEADRGNVSLRYLQKYFSPETLRSVAEPFVRKGLLKGTEYLSATSAHDFTLWGVESPVLYDESLRAYAEVSAGRDRALAYADRLRRSLRSLQKDVYGDELARMDEKRDRRNSEEISLADYFGLLWREAARLGVYREPYRALTAFHRIGRLEKKIEFARVAREADEALALLGGPARARLNASAGGAGHAAARSAMKRGENAAAGYYAALEEELREAIPAQELIRKYPSLAAYFRYLNHARRFEALHAVEELDRLEDEVFGRLARTREEKYLLEFSRNAEDLEAALRLELTPERFARFETRGPRFDTRMIGGYVNYRILQDAKHFDRAVFMNDAYEKTLAEALRFYRLAAKRDQIFVDRMLTVMDEQGETRAAMFAGGFHAPGIKRLLRARGISFVSVLPQVTHETDHARYEKILLAQPAPSRKSRLTAARKVIRTDRAPKAGYAVQPKGVLGGARLAFFEALNAAGAGSPDAKQLEMEGLINTPEVPGAPDVSAARMASDAWEAFRHLHSKYAGTLSTIPAVNKLEDAEIIYLYPHNDIEFHEIILYAQQNILRIDLSEKPAYSLFINFDDNTLEFVIPQEHRPKFDVPELILSGRMEVTSNSDKRLPISIKSSYADIQVQVEIYLEELIGTSGKQALISSKISNTLREYFAFTDESTSLSGAGTVAGDPSAEVSSDIFNQHIAVVEALMKTRLTHPAELVRREDRYKILDVDMGRLLEVRHFKSSADKGTLIYKFVDEAAYEIHVNFESNAASLTLVLDDPSDGLSDNKYVINWPLDEVPAIEFQEDSDVAESPKVIFKLPATATRKITDSINSMTRAKILTERIQAIRSLHFRELPPAAGSRMATVTRVVFKVEPNIGEGQDGARMSQQQDADDDAGFDRLSVMFNEYKIRFGAARSSTIGIDNDDREFITIDHLEFAPTRIVYDSMGEISYELFSENESSYKHEWTYRPGDKTLILTISNLEDVENVQESSNRSSAKPLRLSFNYETELKLEIDPDTGRFTIQAARTDYHQWINQIRKLINKGSAEHKNVMRLDYAIAIFEEQVVPFTSKYNDPEPSGSRMAGLVKVDFDSNGSWHISGRPVLLVVEDNAEQVESYRRFLTHEGFVNQLPNNTYELVMVDNLSDAIKAVERAGLDLAAVLTDKDYYEMSEADHREVNGGTDVARKAILDQGLQLIEALQKIPTARGVQGLLVTGDAKFLRDDQKAKARLLELGFSSHPKPVMKIAALLTDFAQKINRHDTKRTAYKILEYFKKIDPMTAQIFDQLSHHEINIDFVPVSNEEWMSAISEIESVSPNAKESEKVFVTPDTITRFRSVRGGENDGDETIQILFRHNASLNDAEKVWNLIKVLAYPLMGLQDYYLAELNKRRTGLEPSRFNVDDWNDYIISYETTIRFFTNMLLMPNPINMAGDLIGGSPEDAKKKFADMQEYYVERHIEALRKKLISVFNILALNDEVWASGIINNIEVGKPIDLTDDQKARVRNIALGSASELVRRLRIVALETMILIYNERIKVKKRDVSPADGDSSVSGSFGARMAAQVVPVGTPEFGEDVEVALSFLATMDPRLEERLDGVLVVIESVNEAEMLSRTQEIHEQAVSLMGSRVKMDPMQRVLTYSGRVVLTDEPDIEGEVRENEREAVVILVDEEFSQLADLIPALAYSFVGQPHIYESVREGSADLQSSNPKDGEIQFVLESLDESIDRVIQFLQGLVDYNDSDAPLERDQFIMMQEFLNDSDLVETMIDWILFYGKVLKDYMRGELIEIFTVLANAPEGSGKFKVVLGELNGGGRILQDINAIRNSMTDQMLGSIREGLSVDRVMKMMDIYNRPDGARLAHGESDPTMNRPADGARMAHTRKAGPSVRVAVGNRVKEHDAHWIKRAKALLAAADPSGINPSELMAVKTHVEQIVNRRTAEISMNAGKKGNERKSALTASRDLKQASTVLAFLRVLDEFRSEGREGEWEPVGDFDFVASGDKFQALVRASGDPPIRISDPGLVNFVRNVAREMNVAQGIAPMSNGARDLGHTTLRVRGNSVHYKWTLLGDAESEEWLEISRMGALDLEKSQPVPSGVLDRLLGHKMAADADLEVLGHLIQVTVGFKDQMKRVVCKVGMERILKRFDKQDQPGVAEKLGGFVQGMRKQGLMYFVFEPGDEGLGFVSDDNVPDGLPILEIWDQKGEGQSIQSDTAHLPYFAEQGEIMPMSAFYAGYLLANLDGMEASDQRAVREVLIEVLSRLTQNPGLNPIDLDDLLAYEEERLRAAAYDDLAVKGLTLGRYIDLLIYLQSAARMAVQASA